MRVMQPGDLAALATLDALLQESSVSRAARRLGLSTPAVSHALARLRDRFDDPLLVRAGRHMVLTPRAEALKPQVRDAVEAAARVYEPGQTFDPARTDRAFTVNATDYIMVVFGSVLDEAMQREAPGIELRIVPNSVDDAERLRDGTSDLSIGIYGELPPELKTRAVITDRLVSVVREGHELTRGRVTLERWVGHPHIQVAPRGRPGGYVDDMLAARGLSRRVTRAVPYFQVALEMAARSDAVLTVSERIAARLGPGLGLVVLEAPLPLEPFALSMVWHPRFDADPGHRWLREQVVAATKALDGMAHPSPRRRLDSTDPNAR